MSNNYIPRNDEAFDTFFRMLTQYVAAKTSGSSPAWTYIPQDARAALNEAYANWYTAFSKTFNPHTPVETREKNRVRLVSERTLRAFVNQFLRFPPVTDMDRDAMGIPNRDLIRTPHVEVTETVEYELKLRNIREVLVNFWVKGETHRAKPTGYDGAVIVWDVLDTPPARPDDLTLHTMASRTPHAIEFDETERGRTVYIAAAWQNERGNIGQWSEIQSAVVP
ncbi:MAG: hypothetical protein LBQ93_06250 [Treponema sp.]|jgi:hypothetical protein|nr:hypothetical protein [Treponema sp.]